MIAARCSNWSRFSIPISRDGGFDASLCSRGTGQSGHEFLERRSLFDATVADSPVQHPADVEAALMYPTPTPPTVDIASGAAGSEDPADITRPEIGPVPVEFVVSRSGGTMGMGDLDVAYVFVADTAIAGAVLEPTETFFIELGPPPVPGSYVFANPGAPPKAAGAAADNDYEIKTAELGFNSQTILRDDGTGAYAKPQWLDANGDRDAVDPGEKRFPISYVRSRPGSPTRVAVDVKLTVDGKLDGKYLIKGAGIGLPGGVMLEKELTIAPGTTVLETSITSSAALGNVIADGVLTINWTITPSGRKRGISRITTRTSRARRQATSSRRSWTSGAEMPRASGPRTPGTSNRSTRINRL